MHANFAAVQTAVLIFLTLAPRTSEPMRHAPVPPLEQNSGDATAYLQLTIDFQNSAFSLLLNTCPSNSGCLFRITSVILSLHFGKTQTS